MRLEPFDNLGKNQRVYILLSHPDFFDCTGHEWRGEKAGSFAFGNQGFLDQVGDTAFAGRPGDVDVFETFLRIT